MENKKIDTLFGLVLIAFLVVTIILIKDFNTKRANDYKEYLATITNIVKSKDYKISLLITQLAAEKKENQGLKDTLAETRNDLDALTKKLVPQSAPVAAAAAVTK